jgi:hypothetical protein
MDEENVIHTHTHTHTQSHTQGILFRHKEEKNYFIHRKVDGTGDHHINQNKPDTERQTLHVFSHMHNLDIFLKT